MTAGNYATLDRIYQSEKYEELILTCKDDKTNETTTVYPKEKRAVYEVIYEEGKDTKDAEIAQEIDSNYANFHDEREWSRVMETKYQNQEPVLSQTSSLASMGNDGEKSKCRKEQC